MGNHIYDAGMRCYKYVSEPDCLASILAGEMKFTIPAELNDPSELFPRFSREEVLLSLQDLRRRGHSEEEFNGLKRQHALMRALIPFYWRAELPLSREEADLMINLPIFDNIELIEQLFTNMLDAVSSAVAVSCLSKRWNCLPMWANYANRAQGVVVGYDNLDVLFAGDDTGWLNSLKEVSYSRETSGISFYPDSYGSIFFTKLHDWKYEDEIRIATELANCTATERGSALIHTRAVPVSHVSSVIFGWRMAEATVERLTNLLENPDCQHIEPQSATVRRGEIELQTV